MMRSTLQVFGSGAVLAVSALAQVPPLLPYPRTFDPVVVDSNNDCVWRLSDQNQDGDYNDVGEVITFYSDLTAGGIALTNPACITCANDGTTFIADTTEDKVVALRDQNGDGDANDPGEFRVFFTSITNASSIIMASAQGLTVDALGRVWVASSNAGTSGQDIILRLEDLNADGDADDAGESFVYCLIPFGSGAVGNSIPTKVVVGPDLNLYYTDVASSGGNTKGVYKLQDLNNDGDASDTGECVLFWAPPIAAPYTASPFYWSLAVTWTGTFTITDHSTNKVTWRGRDADLSGTISGSEQTAFFTDTGATWWDAALRDDGYTLLVNANGTNRLTACIDLNADGDAMDAGESYLAYSAALAAQAIAVRGAAFLRAPRFDAIAPVQVGNTTALNLAAVRPGDLCISVFSLGLAPVPFPLAPWGKVEIDISQFVVFGFGIADPSGNFAHSFTAPSSPSVVGTYAFQGLCGDNFRMFLSNATPLSITP